jgi:hypothetical protein
MGLAVPFRIPPDPLSAPRSGMIIRSYSQAFAGLFLIQGATASQNLLY